jgi:hypothetical protein
MPYATTSIASKTELEQSYSHEEVLGYVDMDATQERLLRALEADLDACQIEEPEKKRKRRQILHPIEGFFRRGWITERQFLAGMSFRDVIVKNNRTARVNSTMAPFHDHGMNYENVTFQKDHQQAFDSAVKSIRSPSARTFIDWMTHAESNDTGLLDLGRSLTGMRKHAIVRQAAVECLHACLHDLTMHFKIR